MSSSASEVVRTTTGMSASFASALTSASTSRPSFFGRFRSRRMMSGRGTPAYGAALVEEIQRRGAVLDHVETVADLGLLQGLLGQIDVAGVVFHQKNFDHLPAVCALSHAIAFRGGW